MCKTAALLHAVWQLIRQLSISVTVLHNEFTVSYQIFNPITSDCIVLYLYIYVALLEVHTNQKRFQCERPRKKRAVLRERKEALGSPVNKVDRVE